MKEIKGVGGSYCNIHGIIFDRSKVVVPYIATAEKQLIEVGVSCAHSVNRLYVESGANIRRATVHIISRSIQNIILNPDGRRHQRVTHNK